MFLLFPNRREGKFQYKNKKYMNNTEREEGELYTCAEEIILFFIYFMRLLLFLFEKLCTLSSSRISTRRYLEMEKYSTGGIFRL